MNFKFGRGAPIEEPLVTKKIQTIFSLCSCFYTLPMYFKELCFIFTDIDFTEHTVSLIDVYLIKA